MTEITCNNCGSTNIVQEENQYHCQDCGIIFDDEYINQNKNVENQDQTPQQAENELQTVNNDIQEVNNSTQEYNPNQQDNYVYNQTAPTEQKSMVISMLLSLIFLGLGLAYLGFIKRWLIALGISVVISFVFFPLGIVWNLYMLYYTYKCTKCVNEGQPVPPLAGFINLDE